MCFVWTLGLCMHKHVCTHRPTQHNEIESRVPCDFVGLWKGNLIETHVEGTTAWLQGEGGSAQGLLLPLCSEGGSRTRGGGQEKGCPWSRGQAGA